MSSENQNQVTNILVIEDDDIHYSVLRLNIKKYAEEHNLNVFVERAEDKAVAEEKLKASTYEIVFFDLNLPDQLEGLSLLKQHLHEVNYPIILTSEDDNSTLEKATFIDDIPYIVKPSTLKKVEQLFSMYFLKINQKNFMNSIFKEYVTQDSSTIQELKKIPSLLLNDEPVYLHGETGTGKEVIARLVHNFTLGNDKPFVVLNAASINPNLMQSQLFGHKKGSFTGASENRSGFLKEAQGGTLFIDEIGKMPLEVQAALLRVIAEKEFTPVGEEKSIKLNAKIITASKECLDTLVNEGKMHNDFQERVIGNVIKLRPLRERKEDIFLQIDHFMRLDESGQRFRLDDEAAIFLEKYKWYGNTRELRNSVKRWIASGSNKITMAHLKDLKNRVKTVECSTLTNNIINLIEDEGLTKAFDLLKVEAVKYFYAKNNFKTLKTIEMMGTNRDTFNKLKKKALI